MKSSVKNIFPRSDFHSGVLKMIKFKASPRALEISYAIRDLVLVAEKIAKETNEKILYLNIGDPGQFDFKLSDHMKKALCNAVNEDYNFYAHSAGLPELRHAIVEYEKRKNGIALSVDDVFVTSGTAEAINAILAAAFLPGEEILIPSPIYPPYLSAAKFFGVNPVEYNTIEEEGWIPDLDDMRKKVSTRTKELIIINPNNPTGAVYSNKLVKDLIDFAGEYDLFVVSDEIYDQIVYDINKAPNTASLANDVPVLGLFGLSKVYLATGWRLGYVYKHDPNNVLDEIWSAIMKFLTVRISASTPAQKAAIAALLGSQEHIKVLVKRLKERRDFFYRRINEIEGISTQLPKGAFYIFPKIEIPNYSDDDFGFVLDLLKSKKVLFVHGSGFGRKGRGHFRSVFLPPIHVLEEALDRLERFVKEIKK